MSNGRSEATHTHCPYCALQCGMTLTPATGYIPLEVAPRTDFPVNAGALCGKGWSAASLLRPEVRLTTPLVRDGDQLVPTSWDTALDRIAAGIQKVQDHHGRDAVAVFGGGGLTNEKAYSLGKFARTVLRTSQIDYNGRFCMSAAAAANNAAFGMDRGLPFPLEDVARTDCLILVGSNLGETMPPALRYLSELVDNGGTLITVDPRRTRTTERATLHLSPRPGTDAALALGLLHLVIVEGLVDEEFVARRTTGFPAARAAALAYWPERVEEITGVPVPLMRQVVARFTSAPTGMVLTARGSEQHASGVATVHAWINFCLATGKAGRRYCGYGCLTGQGNGQGGREHGQKSDQLPGYRRIDDPAARVHVAAVWGVDPDTIPGPGRPAYQLLDSLGRDGGPRALLVFGSNPVVSAPRASHIQQRLRALDLLVVADVVLSETAELADVCCRSRSGPRRTAPPPTWKGGCCCGVAPSTLRTGSAATWRCSPSSPNAWTPRFRSPPTRRRSSRNCAGPAPAASPTTRASPTRAWRAGSSCSGRCRVRTTPVPPESSRSGSPPRTAGPASSR